MMTDRYLVFRGEDYCAQGGWNDFVGSAQDIRSAIYIATEEPDENGRSPAGGNGDSWYHIVDVHNGLRIVCQGEFKYRTITVSSDRPLDYMREHVIVKELHVNVLASVTCETVARDAKDD